jgi:hypothetical protein
MGYVFCIACWTAVQSCLLALLMSFPACNCTVLPAVGQESYADDGGIKERPAAAAAAGQ